MSSQMDMTSTTAAVAPSASTSTPKARLPMALINPRALSSFLKLAQGDGIDAAGLVDGKGGRILGWEDVDTSRGESEACWLITSLASEGISVSKGNRIGSISVLQGRFSLILVSFGADCSTQVMSVKLDEMKRAIETQFQNVLNGKASTISGAETEENNGPR